ncbi:unnamed protein product, partial [Symbiodinium sp. CCMP2456]
AAFSLADSARREASRPCPPVFVQQPLPGVRSASQPCRKRPSEAPRGPSTFRGASSPSRSAYSRRVHVLRTPPRHLMRAQDETETLAEDGRRRLSMAESLEPEQPAGLPSRYARPDGVPAAVRQRPSQSETPNYTPLFEYRPPPPEAQVTTSARPAGRSSERSASDRASHRRYSHRSAEARLPGTRSASSHDKSRTQGDGALLRDFDTLRAEV